MAGTNSWIGIGRQVLDQYLQAEGGGGGGDAGQMGVDVFVNGFEDEFPGDADDPIGGTYQGYSLEANRASESRPWGGNFSDRPKIHELNQPPAAQVLGWRVIDFYPNRDHKSEFYRLAGTPAELRQMLQVIQATRIVTGARVNFEAWFEQWEKGFPEFTENRSDSNFLLGGEKQWERIKNPETRPRYKELTSSQSRSDLGYRVIEYWKNRKNEKSSHIFSGTDLQLIQHCIQLEYEGGSSTTLDAIPGKNSRPPLRGWPVINLHFSQARAEAKIKADGSLATPVQGEKLIRCVGYTDDQLIASAGFGKMIDSSDIRKWSQKIVEQFATPIYDWDKGRQCLSYSGQLARLQGLEGYAYVNTAAQGKDIFTRLLKIFDYLPDPAGFKYSGNEAEDIAFPVNPPPVNLLGRQWKAEVKRPRASVKFVSATLFLPTINKPIPLVYENNIVYDA